MASEMARPRVDGEDKTSQAPIPRRRFWLALSACIVGIAILAALGTWQVQRLHWKEGLIARIDSRMNGTPVDLTTLEARYQETGDVDYYPVTVSGRFLNKGERYFFSTFGGDSGWNVYTPLLTDGGELLFVNRGFVPYDLKDPAKRRAGQPQGEVTVTGLARDPVPSKPGYFVPDNDPQKNIYFWRDLPTMAGGLDLKSDIPIVPFFVDAGPGRADGGWPIGGTTVVTLPNNHLQYAITWYGIGLVLVFMTGLLIVRDRKARQG